MLNLKFLFMYFIHYNYALRVAFIDTAISSEFHLNFRNLIGYVDCTDDVSLYSDSDKSHAKLLLNLLSLEHTVYLFKV